MLTSYFKLYSGNFSAGNFSSDSYWSPLHYAAALGRSVIVQILLRYGADKDMTCDMVEYGSRTEENITAAQVAWRNGEDYTGDLTNNW